MKLQEQHIYGSARLGVVKPDLEMIGAVDPSDVGEFDRVRGLKRYELSNHLGNVLTVISDRKIATVDNGVNIYYHAEIISYTDYYPFGAPMSQGNTDRTWSVEEYRFGFNGKEQVDEMIGESNGYDFGARMYDTRLGRWWSVDPLFKKYPTVSVYIFTANCPTYYMDDDGRKLKVGGSNSTATDGVSQGVSNFNIACQDLYSLIPQGASGDYFKSILMISPSGEVTLSSIITKNEVLGLNDPGIELLYNLINSEKDYFYEVSYVSKCKTRDGQIVMDNLDEPFSMDDSPDARASNNQISNLSVTRFLTELPSDPTPKDIANFNSDLPVDKEIEGHVTIAPVTRYVFDMGLPHRKSRSSIVFHELLENYERTENGLPYASSPQSGAIGAHDKAIMIENALPKGDARKSSTPGKAEVRNE